MSDSPSKTPGSGALVAMKELQKDIVFKTPTNIPRKRTKRKILDEDAYIEGMDKIIQRDFFPDLDKLKAQNEYLEAVEKNDVIKIREMHLRYTGRRPPTERRPSPANFETPQHVSYTPASEHPTNVKPTEKEPEVSPNLNLDEYLSVHTSEDNESFAEMMLESEKKHRLKYSYLYNEESKSIDEQNQLLMLPSIDQQCQLPEKKLNIDSWGYKNKNYIMYIPDGVAPTKEEIIELNKRKQEVVYTNTRLVSNPFNDERNQETITELAKTQAKVKDGRIGVDGKELVTESPKIRGYNFVRTPSPCPGVLESPLMTWGQIEGTPFMLDGSDTPLPRTSGPSFKMAEPPRREQIALALAEKAGERHRDRKQKAIQAARRQFATPSPLRQATVDRLATMSPAARRLATSKLGLSSSTDLGLRASYSPSPKTTNSRPNTPKTPLVRGVKPITPKLKFGNNITDNLLNINVPKRNKAADFF